jgi:hypothetical protein
VQASLYPQSAGDFAALMAAILPFAAWAMSGLLQALNASTKRSEDEWIRLHQLAEILHEGKTYGVWRQILAVQELERLRTRRTEAKELAKRAERYWLSNRDKSPDQAALLDALRDFSANSDFNPTLFLVKFLAFWMIGNLLVAVLNVATELVLSR